MPTAALTLPDVLTPPPLVAIDGAALFLDLDGVLAPIAPAPDAVGPDPRRTRLLIRLIEALDGRVAVLSGRTIEEIDRICQGAARAVAGVHGLERRRADGVCIRVETAQGLPEAAAELEAFASTRAGVQLETKRGALALHFRQAPEAETEARALASALANQYDLVLQPGKMVFELKTPGADKGSALGDFMAEPPFAGHMPIMLGDDFTDEHAFGAAERLGGFGVLVGPARGTLARHRLADTAAVADWLAALTGTSA